MSEDLLDRIDPQDSPEESAELGSPGAGSLLDTIAPRAETSDIPSPPRGVMYFRARHLEIMEFKYGEWPKYQSNPPVMQRKFKLVVRDLDAVEEFDEPTVFTVYTAHKKPMQRLLKVHQWIMSGMIPVQNPPEDLKVEDMQFVLSKTIPVVFWKGRKDGMTVQKDSVHLLSPTDFDALQTAGRVPQLDSIRVSWERDDPPDDDLGV